MNPSKPALKMALIGNPNCGKTTVFNQLTGANQRVGNWSGVTVSRKIREITLAQGRIELIDFPGIYAILSDTSQSGMDEKLTCDYLQNERPDCILNIVDAASLERNLYLTIQLLEKEIPVIVIINRVDLLSQKASIDYDKLSAELGCPVFEMSSEISSLSTVARLETLKNALLLNANLKKSSAFKIDYPAQIEQAIVEFETQKGYGRAQALIELEYEALNDADIVIAQNRYEYIESLLSKVLTRYCTYNQKTQWKQKLDSFFLHRVFGLPIFLAVMYSLFVFAINVGGAFQDFFDISSNALFVKGVAHLLLNLDAPTWLVALLASGVGKGINTLVTFIPVIGALFLALTFLEESGYMARASFVIDRVMQTFGLPGKSFVPLIVGFGCNVPAVMGARTLEKKRDRILTVLMSPFMSCGARLAIFTLFVSAFFPKGGQNIVFLLYLIGIVMAVLTGLLLKKTLLSGAPSSMVLELPVFRIPKMKSIVPQALKRLSRFIKNAGTVIIPLCIIVGSLNSISLSGKLFLEEEAHCDSVLAVIGKTATPLFKPMGIEADNWPATVGLFTGLLAKELVVGTLNALYTQNTLAQSVSTFDLGAELKSAVYSIEYNIRDLGGAFTKPLTHGIETPDDAERVYGAMIKHFDGKVGAFAYLLFVLLYFPCISVTAAMLKEVDRKWTLFSVVWTTGVAYGAAVLFYQVATFYEHPQYSLFWITLIITSVISVMMLMNHLKFKVARSLPTRIVLSN